MEIFYANINELVQDLLIPARTEKKIDIQVYEKFYGSGSQMPYGKLFDGDPGIPAG